MASRRDPLRKSRRSASPEKKMPILRWEMIMRFLASALIALSVLAGIVAPADAFDSRSYFQQLERNLP